jgi:hypothetical protein
MDDLAILEKKRTTFALEGNVIMPHWEMAAAGVVKRWGWGKIKR